MKNPRIKNGHKAHFDKRNRKIGYRPLAKSPYIRGFYFFIATTTLRDEPLCLSLPDPVGYHAKGGKYKEPWHSGQRKTPR
jgi:hypothetical protein